MSSTRQIKNLNLNEILRYVITGIWILMVFQIVNDICFLPNPFVITILAITIGAISYFIFRSIIHPTFTRLLDLFFLSGRNLIKEQFGIKEWIVRSDIWNIHQAISNKKFPGDYYVWSSSVHLLMISGISSLVGYFLCDPNKIKLLLILSFILILSGIISHILYEIRLRNYVLLNSYSELKELINKYKENSGTLSAKDSISVPLGNFSLIGLIFNLLGTVALSTGLLLSDKQIRELSTTYWDSNIYLQQSLKQDRLWAIIGFSLIIIGFLIQLISAIKERKLK